MLYNYITLGHAQKIEALCSGLNEMVFNLLCKAGAATYCESDPTITFVNGHLATLNPYLFNVFDNYSLAELQSLEITSKSVVTLCLIYLSVQYAMHYRKQSQMNEASSDVDTQIRLRN